MRTHHTTHRLLAVGACLAMVAALSAVASTATATVPDANGTLVFERVDFQGLGDHGLQAIQPDGSGLRTLASQQHAFFESPDWSPDGSQVAVSKWGPATGDLEPMPGQDIWVMDADGGNLHNVTNSPDTGDYHPLWSPNGALIAYQRVPRSGDAGGDIWLHSPASGQHVPFTATPGIHETPQAWSPDGTRLLFTSSQVDAPGRDAAVESIRADGTARTVLAADLPVERPVWSPTGGRIAYCQVMRMVANRTADGPAEVPSYDVWTMDADGANRENLTGTASASECNPRWTPDGRLTYVADGDIWVMDSDGNKKTKLGPGGNQVISPDGSMIAFTRPEIVESDWGTTSIWVMDGDGSSPRQLTSGDYWDRGLAWQPLPIRGAGLVDVAAGIWHLGAAPFYYGNPGDHPMLGDWDCDGIETPGLYRRSDGFVYLRNAATPGIADVRYFFGDPGDVPIAGDFDGDGCDTVSLYRPSEGRVYIHDALGSGEQGLGAAELSYYFGNPADKPFAGDFDGDGVDTVGLHRETSGLVYFRNSHTAGPADLQFVYGDPGDRLVAHDWAGRGMDSVAVFRPADARFYFRFSNTPGFADATLQQGDIHDWPVAGAVN